MKGRKIPFTKSRAIAYMRFNEVFGNERKALKKQARKEVRRYQNSIILKEFENELLNSQIDLESEINDYINDNFWEIV